MARLADKYRIFSPEMASEGENSISTAEMTDTQANNRTSGLRMRNKILWISMDPS